MNDIGPTRILNKKLTLAIVVMAALPLYLGISSMTFLPVDEWTWSAVPLSIGVLLLGLAARAWFRPPMNTAQIRFRDGGFRLETKQILNGEKTYDINWSDTSAIVKFDGGLYGGRSIRILGKDGSRTAWFAASWTELSGYEIIDRLSASAEAAGYAVEREAGFWKGLVRTRWDVREKA